MMAAKYALDSRLVGAARRDGQAQWDEHGAQIALRAAAENPGKRILMLTGVYNAARAVDVAAWLGEMDCDLVRTQGIQLPLKLPVDF